MAVTMDEIASYCERVAPRVLAEGRGTRATLFITGDVRYHDAQDAVARGLDLAILDHFATERPVLDVVKAALSELLPGIAIHLASSSSSPYVRIEP